MRTLARELYRAEGRVASVYDTGITNVFPRSGAVAGLPALPRPGPRRGLHRPADHGGADALRRQVSAGRPEAAINVLSSIPGIPRAWGTTARPVTAPERACPRSPARCPTPWTRACASSFAHGVSPISSRPISRRRAAFPAPASGEPRGADRPRRPIPAGKCLYTRPASRAGRWVGKPAAPRARDRRASDFGGP